MYLEKAVLSDCIILFSLVKSSQVAQSYPTLWDPIDCSLPDSSVHGIFQAIVLEWIAISFSRGSSQSRNRTRVSRIVDRHFTIWATREVTCNYLPIPEYSVNDTWLWFSHLILVHQNQMIADHQLIKILESMIFLPVNWIYWYIQTSMANLFIFYPWEESF